MKPSCIKRQYIQVRKSIVTKMKPICPKCGSSEVELLDFLTIPAYWKCRKCKEEFEYEESVCQ